MNDQSQLLGIIIADFLKVPQIELLPIQTAIDNLVRLLKVQTSRSLTSDEGVDLALTLTSTSDRHNLMLRFGMCPVGQKLNFS